MTDTKNNLKELALKRATALNIIEPNEVRRSESYGVLLDLTPAQKEKIKEIEADGEHAVYHLVRTRMSLGGDIVTMTAYLVVTKEDIDEDGEDIGFDDFDDTYGYRVFAYVVNEDWDDCSEWGYIMVKPSFGGLKRTA